MKMCHGVVSRLTSFHDERSVVTIKDMGKLAGRLSDTVPPAWHFVLSKVKLVE